MLPSTRHFLKYIDAYEKWDAHGFQVKVTNLSLLLDPSVERHWLLTLSDRMGLSSVLTGLTLKHVSCQRLP